MRNSVFRLYYWVRLFICIAWIAGCAAGIWWSLRLARADALFRRNTPEAVKEAVSLAPGNTTYRSLQALQIEYAGGDPSHVWEEMARRRPTDATYWILLGIRKESEGKLAEAERDLLRAAIVNTQYEPRWTLANFYFRRGLKPEFQQWAKAAMRRMYDDPRPLFELSGRLGDFSLEVPDTLRSAYAGWLIEKQKPVEAVRVAASLRPVEDRESILGITESLQAVNPEVAFSIWRKLNFTPSPDFQPLLGRGFDWRIAQVEGIRAAPTEEPSLRIVFDGKEPESAEILSRVFLNQSTPGYHLRWESRTSATLGVPGVSWRIGSVSAPLKASDVWQQAELTVPPVSGPSVRLALVYQRPAGSPRFDGTLWLRHVTLEAARP